MKSKFLPVLFTGMLMNLFYTPLFSQELNWLSSGNGGIVAAGPKPSVQAGIDILRKGGNAVDGAVAVIFNLAVSDYGMFCIGGEVPFIFFSSDERKVMVFNGMGGAPKDPEAIEWYYKNGIPSVGIRSATVPSAVSTLLSALAQKGTMSFEQIILPTLSLLDTKEKSWYENLAVTLRKLIEAEKSTTGTREMKIRAARDRFYKGDIADELTDYYIKSGAFLRKADLEAHETIIEEPASVKYRDFTVNKCNTWTQGPVMLQSLKLLENFNLKSLGFMSPDYVHVMVEAMKLAYADRDRYYGDPRFSEIPLAQLLSDKYNKIRYPLIDMNHASVDIRPSNPYKMKAEAGPGEYRPGEHGTTTCVVADRWGNVVAATPSANPDYGICQSLGIAHNTRLSSLNIQKGHPNALEPGKRPRITLTPTIVLKNGKPVIAMSVAGGDMQDQVSLQLFLSYAEYGKMPEDAITAPRFKTYHMQDSFNPSPSDTARIFKIGALDINPVDKKIVDELTGRGHEVTVSNISIANPVMVYFDQASGMAYAACNKGKFSGALEIKK